MKITIVLSAITAAWIQGSSAHAELPSPNDDSSGRTSLEAPFEDELEEAEIEVEDGSGGSSAWVEDSEDGDHVGAPGDVLYHVHTWGEGPTWTIAGYYSGQEIMKQGAACTAAGGTLRETGRAVSGFFVNRIDTYFDCVKN